jgi:two-component system, sensor histidine kinase
VIQRPPTTGLRRGATHKPQASYRQKRDLEVALAALAHEIRTPLTGVLALAELLAASEIPERERQWAAAVKSAAEHLAHLTTLVVDGVNAGRAGLAASPEPFEPRALGQTMATALSARAAAKGLAAEVAIADDLPSLVIGEPVRLRAALENVIDNAVKFTECGQVGLEVGCQPAGRNCALLVFTVKDSGIGLTASEIKQLFRPFGQASEMVARRFGGAGLGLNFARRLAKTMHGDLTVESVRALGSTFRLVVTVELPRTSRRREAPASRSRRRA